MFSWKQRLYALILRRILGPLLSTEAHPHDNDQHLLSYTNIQQVSLTEGSYIFNDLSFNTQYISSQFLNDLVTIVSFTIRTIQIDIRLVEEECGTAATDLPTSSTTTTGTTTSTSTLAWRALKFSIDTASNATASTTDQPPSSSKVSLVVHIRLEGVAVVMEPSFSTSTSSTTPANNNNSNNDHNNNDKNYNHEEPPLESPDESTLQATAQQNDTTSNHDNNNNNTKTATSFLSSFLESVLTSLRLSMELQNVRIRFQQPQQPSAVPVVSEPPELYHQQQQQQQQQFIEIQTQSILYRDLRSSAFPHHNHNNHAPLPILSGELPPYETTLNKALDMTRITVLTGRMTIRGSSIDTPTADSMATTVVLLDGTSRACIRVVEYHHEVDHHQVDHRVGDTAATTATHRQQDVQISLHQKLNISVDIDSLQLIRAVVHGFLHHVTMVPQQMQQPQASPLSSSMAFSKEFVRQHHPAYSNNNNDDNDDENDDEADCRILKSIMEQYREARLLVEKKEIRGGILFPSFEEDGQLAFDTFFDANQSISVSSQQHRHSSILKESILGSMFYSNGGDCTAPKNDWIYRKFSLHLQEGGIKITLPPAINEPRRPPYLANEYVLLTFNDIDLSVQMSTRSSKYTFSLNHFEIEDAVLARNGSSDERDNDVTEVGTMLRFVHEGDCDDDDEDEIDLLVQAPCLSVSVDITTDDKSDTMDWDIIMEPVEVSYREELLAKLVAFFQVDASNNPPILEKPKHTTITVNAACASLTVLLPMSVNGDDIRHIYDRAGYVSESTMVRESALGLVCERIACEIQKTDASDKTNDAVVSCHNIVVFMTTPVTRYSAFDNRTHRLDFVSICGLTEIDPCIPISIRCNRFSNVGVSNETVHDGRILAESLFPRVPPLSSYKARQEDDDDETTREDMKLNDSQTTMLSALADINTIVSVNVPEIIIDISASEIHAIGTLIDLQSSPNATAKTNSKTDDNSAALCAACSVNTQSILLFLHVENNLSYNSEFALSLEDVKVYFATEKEATTHLRVLIHDFDFLEFLTPCQSQQTMEATSARERARTLQRRGSCDADCIVIPILYRSSLFIPISPLSPSIHFDFHRSKETPSCPTNTVYINVFHTSYRHQHDCSWMKRLSSLLSHNSANPKIEATSLVRLFITVTDCNLDYVPPQTFHTASRTILRIGDMRLSSNLVSPSPLKQAFACSISNTELLLCCRRFGYNFENRRMVSSADVMKPDDVSMHAIGLPDEADSNDVLRLMNYRTMATMESINLQVFVCVGERSAVDPTLSVHVSSRQICVFACRDSLARFSDMIGEASAEMAAISAKTFEELRSKSSTNTARETENDSSLPQKLSATHTQKHNRDSDISFIQSTSTPIEFLLDGYDWTAIDSDELGKTEIPQGEEQSARWFTDGELQAGNDNEIEIAIVHHDGNAIKTSTTNKGPPIITHHFNLHPVVDPIGDGDMGATKYANVKNEPRVQARVIIRDLAIRLRFFDGYDWPELLNDKARSAPRSESFVIPEVKKKSDCDESSDESTSTPAIKGEAVRNRKSVLLEDLLIERNKIGSTFANIPLPDEHVIRMKEQDELRRLARRTSKFFQIEASGVVARIDSMEECNDHRLVSCVNLMINDLFLAESISSEKSVKMIGEWFNEQEHPRDSKEGLILMKMVTWHPLHRISPDNKVANDESDVCLKIHPLRCLIDQRAVQFIRAFFNTDNDYGDLQSIPSHVLPPHLHAVPPPIFTSFRVQPLKLKVDYRPQKLDTSALRNGAVVELINLSPLDGMVLTLQSVHIENEVGFGSAMSLVVRRWVEDICATQLHKFVTKSRPFETITEVGAAATDIIVLPWEAFRNQESIAKALKAGAKSFSKVAMYELLNTTSRVANFVGSNVSRVSEISSQSRRTGGNLLPERPVPTPRTILETGPHALESLSRGLQEANYTIVIVPYREYHRSGASGAAYSVIKGIPVAIAAPTSGAAEALSYALLGARNQIRPDIRKEDEATFRGLHEN